MALTKNQVSQLYVTLFGRASEGEGNTYWQSKDSLSEAADIMLSTDAAATYFGASLDTDLAYIQYIYANTLGKTYAQDTAGVDYWVDRLTSGDTRGEVAAALCTAVYDYADSTDVATKAAYNRFVNRVAVSDYAAENIETVDAADTATLAEFTGYISGVTDDVTTTVAARAAIDADANPTPPDPTLVIHTLTPSADNYIGSDTANDQFNGTFDDGVVTDTFNLLDTLDGGLGTDTLHIDHFIDTAITPVDALWAGISGIENIVINTTGSGAQTITTGTDFQAAFAPLGVNFTTTTSGAGAININMSTFTGLANITTESLAGAQVILTGSGAATVDASSTGGALTIQGAGLTTATAMTTGAGAQIIGGGTDALGGNLTLVNANAASGAQTIISTSVDNVRVNVTHGADALLITTGAGDDIITLTDTDMSGENSINTGAGNDTITGGSDADTINAGEDNDIITGGDGIDIITSGSGNDTLIFNGIVLAANANNVADFSLTDTIQVAAANFDNTAGGPVVIGTNLAITALGSAEADEYVMVDTATNITLFNNTGGEFTGTGSLAYATDTGALYYDADGNFSAGAVVIGMLGVVAVTETNFDFV